MRRPLQLHPMRLAARLGTAFPRLRPLLLPYVERRFDLLAPHWDRIRSADGGSTARLLDAALEAIRARDSGFAPEAVLDVGSGTGQAAFLLHERLPAALIEGVDASARMVLLASAKLRDEPIRFRQADAADLPFGNGAFGLAVSLCVPPFHAELQRVLAPGGWSVFAYTAGPGTPIYFSPAQLARGLRAAGFEAILHGTVGRGEWTAARRA